MKRPAPRLRDAMPRPLLVVFAVACVVALAAAVVLVIRPPSFETVPLQERRPPPDGALTHDVDEIFPAALPETQPRFDPPCPAVEGVSVLAGPAGAVRLRSVLGHACTLTGPALTGEVRSAVGALGAATIRFAQFRRTGAESALDRRTGTIWLNIKYAERDLPVTQVVPVLLHEGAHLADPDPTAAGELRARRVEERACRELITPDDWPRWCSDAAAIVALGEEEALALLVRAGFGAP